MLFVGSKSWQNDLAKLAIVGMPAILLAEIDLLDLLFNFFFAHREHLPIFLLLLGSLGSRHLLCDLFDPELIYEQIRGVCCACSGEDADVALVRAAHSLDDGPSFFSCSSALLARV